MSTINAVQIVPRPASSSAPGAGEDAAPEQVSDRQSGPFARLLAEAQTRPVGGECSEVGPGDTADTLSDEGDDAMAGMMAAVILAAAVLPPPVVSPTPVAFVSGDKADSPLPVAAVTALDAEALVAPADAEVEVVVTTPEIAGAVVASSDAAKFEVAARDRAPRVPHATAAPAVVDVRAAKVADKQPETTASVLDAETKAETSPAPLPAPARPEVGPELEPEAEAVSPLTAAIRAAAARVGHGPEISAPGRRLSEVVVTAIREGQSQEPVEGTMKGVALSDLVRQAIDGAREGLEQQAMPDGFGSSSTAETLKLAGGQKPENPAATFFDLGQAGLGGAAESSASVKSRLEAPGDSAKALLPESVSVRETGDAVIRSVRYLSGKTDEVITVRLVPRSLGEMQVAVRTSAEGVDVVLTASTSAAREVLEGHVAGLRQAMGREGIELNRVTIQVFGQFDAGHQTAPGQHGQQGQAGHSARYAPSAYRDSAGHEQGDRGQQQDRRQRHDGRLNMWA